MHFPCLLPLKVFLSFCGAQERGLLTSEQAFQQEKRFFQNSTSDPVISRYSSLPNILSNL
jgi:hypothetical protein